MIKLKFKNSFGEVCFEQGKWHLTEAEGLSLPPKQISACAYINAPGQETVSARETARTITLSGDIAPELAVSYEYGRACGIFAKEGYLYIETDTYSRRIASRCIDFVPGERHGAYRKFVVQFLCDSPFFEDVADTETVIYERVPLLGRDTVLPAVFSTRISKGDVSYPGTAFCEPTIYVNIPSGSGSLTLANITNGGRIAFAYDADLFSQLVIDVKNRTVTDENGISRLDTLTDDSFFDGFRLEPGSNRLEVINSDVSKNVDARMRYKIRYQEAIV